MTKLEAWKAWCESAGTPDLATEFTLEQSSHGKAFSFAWERGVVEREKVAAWMMDRGYATGHGDTVEDLLKELEWQIRESEREAIAQSLDKQADLAGDPMNRKWAQEMAAAVRARGQI